MEKVSNFPISASFWKYENWVSFPSQQTGRPGFFQLNHIFQDQNSQFSTFSVIIYWKIFQGRNKFSSKYWDLEQPKFFSARWRLKQFWINQFSSRKFDETLNSVHFIHFWQLKRNSQTLIILMLFCTNTPLAECYSFMNKERKNERWWHRPFCLPLFQ